jgi:HEAT repeat protein
MGVGMQPVVEQLLGSGVSAVAEVAVMAGDAAGRTGFKARYALDATAAAVSVGGREQQRRQFIEGIRDALTRPLPPGGRKVLLHSLAFSGDSAAAEVVGQFLTDEEACATALWVLSRIGGDAAAAQLRAALPRATMPARRAQILRGLGDVRDAQSLPALTAALGDSDHGIRIAAAAALGCLADPASAEALMKSGNAASGIERAEMRTSLLTVGRRLLDADRKADAARFYAAMWNGTKEPHLRAAAIGGLAASGDWSSEAIKAAIADDDPRPRSAAVLAVAGEAPASTLAGWYAAMPDESARALFLRGLVRRGERAASPLAMTALRDASPLVRDAAVLAAAKLCGAQAVPLLLEMLKNGATCPPTVRPALEQMPGREVSARIVEAVAGSPPAMKVELLEILMARGAVEHVGAAAEALRDADGAVRVAAVKVMGAMGEARHVTLLLNHLGAAADEAERSAIESALAGIARRGGPPVVASLVQRISVAPAERASLLRALGQTGAAEALGPLRAAWKEGDAAMRDAALRGLSNWPTEAPMDVLLEAAQGPDPRWQVLALRGYARMVQLCKASPERRLEMAMAGLKASRRPEERKLLMPVLATIASSPALKVALEYLDDPGLTEEAGSTAMAIARAIQGADPAAARAAAATVAAKCKTPRTLQDASRIMDGSPRR